MDRDFNYDIMDEIKKRWSPRAFSREKISIEDIRAIIEAARYAPSCFNEQPWKFIVAYTHEDIELMRSFLMDSNRVWADNAPVLIALVSRKKFLYNGKENFWHSFDAGTAWGYLSLEAQKRGLITHAMGGFKRKIAAEKLGIPEDYEILSIIAVGKQGNSNELSEELKLRETPGTRVKIDDIISFGKF